MSQLEGYDNNRLHRAAREAPESCFEAVRFGAGAGEFDR